MLVFHIYIIEGKLNPRLPMKYSGLIIAKKNKSIGWEAEEQHFMGKRRKTQ